MIAEHELPLEVPFYSLSIHEAFRDLTPKQRLYAHHMLTASWAGTTICSEQLSPEALPLLRFFFHLFSATPVEEVKRRAAALDGVTAEDISAFMVYVATLYASMGNYLSFGDSKFIPRCSAAVMQKICTAAGHPMPADLLNVLFDVSESCRILDYPPAGITRYYSPNITREDAVLANDYLSSKAMDGTNTRVWKMPDGSLEIRIASVEKTRRGATEEFNGTRCTLVWGDFSEPLTHVHAALKAALPYVENPTQQRMLEHYLRHFLTGDVDAHKESQKEWVKDVGPAVETNIGFIESYRDPSGVRAEWEGFVSIVNKVQSQQYSRLVASAKQFIQSLPWGPVFEKDVFISPDFTSLDILGFASSGIPAGICIPNYDDVRQDHGFKNVYLNNIVNVINFDVKLSHITEADWADYRQAFVHAMSINVGVHELLGHGTGKLFIQKEDGSKNFSPDAVDPISGKPVASWYKSGETFSTVFGGLGSSYEECRAEAVALYLGIRPELMKIFEVSSAEEQLKVAHILWLNMVRAGLLGLEFYSPEGQQWRQAHMRARFCILQSLLRAENPIVTIREDDAEGLIIEVDRNRIATDGAAAIGELLLHLNVNKALANASRGSAYYEGLTSVDEKFLRYRDIVMAKRKPRKQFIQPHTVLNKAQTDVELVEFNSSPEGCIESMVRRHTDIPL